MKNLCGEYVQLPTLQVMEIVMAQIRPPRQNIFNKKDRKYHSWSEYETDYPNQKVVLKFEEADHYRGLAENLCNFLGELKDDLNAIIYGEEKYQNDPPVYDRKKGIIHEGYKKINRSQRDELKRFIFERVDDLWGDSHSFANNMDYHINQFDELTPYEKSRGVMHKDYEPNSNIEKLKSEGTND
jgi:hypothetical protein|tara:strand:+ start:283 stop:834 length:552 start_codon:yes stop_codon:yes gene_type:complete